MTKEQFIEKWRNAIRGNSYVSDSIGFADKEENEFISDLNSLFNLRTEEEKPQVIQTKGVEKYLGIIWFFESKKYLLDKEYFDDNTVKLTWYNEDKSLVIGEQLIYKLNASYQFRR